MDNPDRGCLARLRETEVQPGFVAQLQATLTLVRRIAASQNRQRTKRTTHALQKADK
jgi:hypothetical protein